MKYIFRKTVNGKVILADGIELTEKSPVLTLIEGETKNINMDTYLKDNPFVKVEMIDDTSTDCTVTSSSKKGKNYTTKK